jgi:predicted O-methyltransferase YrrM
MKIKGETVDDHKSGSKRSKRASSGPPPTPEQEREESLKAVQKQLAETCNDPNLTITTGGHSFPELDMPVIERRKRFSVLIDHLGLKKGAEIGVYEAGFSHFLLKNSSLTTLYSIDPWTNVEGDLVEEIYLTAAKKLRAFDERSIIIKARSIQASEMFDDGALDFVYIDADHRYKSAYDDLRAWYPKVRSGGVFSGHDYTYKGHAVCEAMTTKKFPRQGRQGVKQAVDEFAKEMGLELRQTEERSPSWWFLVK